MELATQLHLLSLRQALEYRLHELSTELHAAELARGAAVGAGGPVKVGIEEQRRIDEASLVQGALRRLDLSCYGDCQDCGQPIALQRLRVQPAAPRCAGCEAALAAAGRDAVDQKPARG